MKTCPRCGSEKVRIKLFPYRNQNIACRNGWHNVGTNKALDRSSLTHELDSDNYVDGGIPVIKVLHEANNRIEQMRLKLQQLYDNSPLIAITEAERRYVQDMETFTLDIAKILGVRLQEREKEHG